MLGTHEAVVASPVDTDPGEPARELIDGPALCLSGGGYRAMVFHLGTLWRLNELGWLRKLARVSSVSGGSITAGVLGLNWKHLKFNTKDQAENLIDVVIGPLMDFASRTIDEKSI